MKQWRLVAAWLAVAVLATTVTWQIVSLADDRVGEADTAPLNVSTPSSTTQGSATSTVATSTTGTTSPSTSSSSSPTSAPAEGELLAVPTVGGTVTVRVSPGSITYVSAVPAAGFAIEIDDAGPPDVRVELVSATSEIEVRVRWRDGEVRIEVEQN